MLMFEWKYFNNSNTGTIIYYFWYDNKIFLLFHNYNNSTIDD